jgi:thymidine kinase
MSKLDVFLGPMFSGKSTELIRIIRLYRIINKKILIIKPIIDNRYNSDSITNHNNESEKSISVNNLSEIQNIQDYDLIIIDEGQFFNDLKENIKKWIDNYNIKIIVAGLDGDYNRNPFYNILEILPLADNFVKYKSLCNICNDGTEAIYTFRKSNSNEQILIGSNEYYIPVCREHYIELNNKKIAE